MNLREALKKILSEWNSEIKKPFGGNQLANFIRNDWARIVKSITDNINSSYIIKASAGAGNWANVPWLSILDPRITNTTQDGIYPVYLFRADGSGLYLSLNQGTTIPTKELGQQASENRAFDISRFIRKEIKELTSWNSDSLDLKANTTLGKSYEKPNIGAKYYSPETLPSNEGLENDLKKILDIYEQVAEHWPKFSNYTPFPENQYEEELSLGKQPCEPNLSIPKPFLLLAGISGTGKTRFVRTQASRSNGWEADDPRKPKNYELVAVRPDWHEPSDLLGYVSRINEEKYVPTGFLSFLIKAWKEVFETGGSLSSIGESTRPFWLCLDEMNLAPVEQYFADYLAILETRKWTEDGYSSLPLISDSLKLVMEALNGSEEDDHWKAFLENNGIPIPPNLIVAGTVNMDETTHGFSRKVIDRALTLDFQEFFPNNFDEFFNPGTEPKLLWFSTSSQISSPADLSEAVADPDGRKSIQFISAVNDILKSTSFELAYRALNELLLSVKCFKRDDEKT